MTFDSPIFLYSNSAFPTARGGDTLAAVDIYEIADDVFYISAGGDTCLEFLEGKQLPAVAMLEQRKKDNEQGDA